MAKMRLSEKFRQVAGVIGRQLMRTWSFEQEYAAGWQKVNHDDQTQTDRLSSLPQIQGRCRRAAAIRRMN